MFLINKFFNPNSSYFSLCNYNFNNVITPTAIIVLTYPNWGKALLLLTVSAIKPWKILESLALVDEPVFSE